MNLNPQQIQDQLKKLQVVQKIQEFENKVAANNKSAPFAKAELNFYQALERVIKGEADMADLGLMDAINDTLQLLRVVAANKSFYLL